MADFINECSGMGDGHCSINFGCVCLCIHANDHFYIKLSQYQHYSCAKFWSLLHRCVNPQELPPNLPFFF